MRRRPDWRIALHAAIEDHRREPFVWGERDCALFAADCVAAMTGEDLAAPFRGRYATPRGALRILRAAGHADLVALVSARLDPLAPMRAHAGDLVVFATEGPFGVSLGIVQGERAAVRLDGGIGSLPRLDAIKAFRIP